MHDWWVENRTDNCSRLNHVDGIFVLPVRFEHDDVGRLEVRVNDPVAMQQPPPRDSRVAPKSRFPV